MSNLQRNGMTIAEGVILELARMVGLDAELALRGGIRLGVSWWRLDIWVIQRFYYLGGDSWLPAVKVGGRDPDGRFGRPLDYRPFAGADNLEWDRALKFGHLFRLTEDCGLSNAVLAAAGYKRRLRGRQWTNKPVAGMGGFGWFAPQKPGSGNKRG